MHKSVVAEQNSGVVEQTKKRTREGKRLFAYLVWRRDSVDVGARELARRVGVGVCITFPFLAGTLPLGLRERFQMAITLSPSQSRSRRDPPVAVCTRRLLNRKTNAARVVDRHLDVGRSVGWKAARATG